MKSSIKCKDVSFALIKDFGKSFSCFNLMNMILF